MTIPKIKQAQMVLGGKLIPDPYPYFEPDAGLWIELLTASTDKGIGLYGTLMKIRAIGATLRYDGKIKTYRIEPMYRGNGRNWGWPNEEAWKEERNKLAPYKDVLIKLLRELKG